MSHYDASVWRAEWTAAGTPKGPIVHVRVKLADASRQGRALVASCGPRAEGSAPGSQSVSRQSISRQSQTQTKSHQSQSESRRSPATQTSAACRLLIVARRKTAEECAMEKFAEDEQNRAIARCRPFLRVAAVSATIRGPRSPDHYGFACHLASDARQAQSPEERPEAGPEPMTHQRH